MNTKDKIKRCQQLKTEVAQLETQIAIEQAGCSHKWEPDQIPEAVKESLKKWAKSLALLMICGELMGLLIF